MHRAEDQTQIALPTDLVNQIDKLVGVRRRRQFLLEAVAEKLRHEERLTAFLAVAGALKDEDIPGWETPDATSAWVRSLRREDDLATERSLRSDSQHG